MTIQIVLTPSTEQILSKNALQHGMQPAEYATYLLEQTLQPATGVALLEQWIANNDPEDAAEQAQTFAELQVQLDQNRSHSARKLFTP